MQNRSLIDDYIKRSENRIYAIKALMERESWADVVRESQEVVELSLKALVRFHLIEVTRIHDVSSIIEENREKFKDIEDKDLERFIDVSRRLRRDRELAFYGSEDLTPSEFYKKKDADLALSDAEWLVACVKKAVSK